MNLFVFMHENLVRFGWPVTCDEELEFSWHLFSTTICLLLKF